MRDWGDEYLDRAARLHNDDDLRALPATHNDGGLPLSVHLFCTGVLLVLVTVAWMVWWVYGG